MKEIIPLALALLTCSGLMGQDTSTSTSANKSTSITMLPSHLVIAHRGTTYWAPEETEAAMRWARNIGADYLEFDLQRTKDGYLIALHDEKLTRTTDIAQKYPDRKDQPISAFTYEELLYLDAGAWFNQAYPDRARTGFIGLDILTLEDVIQIAEGKRIKRTMDGKRIFTMNKTGRLYSEYEPDPADNGHRPGIYPETKVPELFLGIEQDLLNELTRLGWYHEDAKRLKPIAIKAKGNIEVANTVQRVVLQTFSKKSLATLHATFPRPLPTCFLLWRGNNPDDIPNDGLITFEEWVNYGLKNGATIIGPSIAGTPNNYPELLSKEQASIIKKAKLQIHAYSFDTKEQMNKYAHYVDGMFTNKADEALQFYHSHKKDIHYRLSAQEVMTQLGY